MRRCWGDSREELAFCGSGASLFLATHTEEDEDENDLVLASTPPRVSRIHSPLHHELLVCDSPPPRVMSPSSSVSTWSPEPSSPVGWNEDCCEEFYDDRHEFKPVEPSRSHEDAPFLPSLFSPWMCVYDLDAACGPNVHSAVIHHDTTTSNSSRAPASSQSQQQQPDRLSTFPTDWNDLIPSMDLSFWFGDGSGSMPEQPMRKISSENSIVETSSHCANRIRPVPVYPSSLQTQYFTNFASEHEIEAIYVPVCAFQTKDLAHRIPSS